MVLLTKSNRADVRSGDGSIVRDVASPSLLLIGLVTNMSKQDRLNASKQYNLLLDEWAKEHIAFDPDPTFAYGFDGSWAEIDSLRSQQPPRVDPGQKCACSGEFCEGHEELYHNSYVGWVCFEGMVAECQCGPQ
jgi:hypothetical protein